MKTGSILGSLLLASIATASPVLRYDQRGRLVKGPGLPLALDHTGLSDNVVIPQTSEVTYDSNWAGAIQIGSGITQVTGTFNVPEVSAPSGSSSGQTYGAAAWVGIDGDTCQSAILQTGVSFIIENGQTTYSGWYEWYPAPSTNFNGFQVSAGDNIKATVIATSATAGSATLENTSTGQSITHHFGNQTASLCMENAEWIVEDFESGSSLVSFADFKEVTFTGAEYTTGGSSEGLSGATITDIKQGSDVLTQCTTSSSSSLTCTYE